MIKQISPTDWVIMEKLSKSEMDILGDVLSKLNRKDVSLDLNHKLAGQIDDEYNIEYPSNIQDFLFNNLRKYKTEITNIESKYTTPKSYKNFEFRFKEDSWVNFQKKLEYNPLHRHSGDFSFVIWYKIPYTSSDEAKIGPGKNDKIKTNGSFKFVYSLGLGNIDSILIPGDKSMEGTILIFPSSLHHCVYPFYTSDEERISFSGNFYHKPDYDIKITNTLI
jgi:hypothetical protein